MTGSRVALFWPLAYALTLTQSCHGDGADGVCAMQNEFDRIIRLGDAQESVDAAMTGKCVDRHLIRWGGSGGYSIYYLLRETTQLRVDFDRSCRVERVPVVMSTAKWQRNKDGVLINPPE